MVKSKINKIESKEYDCGRVDLFTIEISEDLHKHIISLLLKLGFEFNEVEDFDTIYENEELFIFAYKKNLKIYLINGTTLKEISLIIDSTLRKEELISMIKKDFQIY